MCITSHGFGQQASLETCGPRLNLRRIPIFSLHLAGITWCAFATLKALQTHLRAKHKQRSAFAQYLNTNLTCPVCYIKFGNVTRLLGHFTEARMCGSRRLSCNQVLKAGLVKAVPPATQEAVQKLARAEGAKARKLGHTTPRVAAPAKSPKPDTIIPEIYRNVRPRTFDSNASQPCNALD